MHVVWQYYKYIIVVGLILGIFVWYLRFLKESEVEEGFETEPIQRIKSALKRADDEFERMERRKEASKKVRFLANETSKKWSMIEFLESLKRGTVELFLSIWKSSLGPYLHKFERMIFRSG